MLRIEVVWCPAPGRIDLTPLSLPDGSTAADALRASGVLERHGLVLETVDLGVWFVACSSDQVLRDGDQVQLYRPLTVDPKEARRQRYRGKRAKTVRAVSPVSPVSDSPTR